MRTTGLIVVAAAAVVNAGNPGYTIRDGKYLCDKPNTSYCLGGDIILRCDAYGSGTPGRCSSNLSGYAPLGGVASCYEKLGTYGEAACEKNCVVYATDGPYTLPAELCHPSYTSTAPIQTLTTVYTHPTAQTTTAVYTNSTTTRGPGKPGESGKPEESGKPGHHGHHGNSTAHPEPTGYTTKCATIVYPNPTHPGNSVTRTLTYTLPVYPTNTETQYTHNPVPTTFHPVPSGSPPPPPVNNGTYHGGHGGKGDGHQGSSGNQNEAPNGGNNGGSNGGSSASGSGTKVPISPTSSAVPETVTGGAAMNTVSGMLAVVAVVAAYLL